MNKYIVTFRNSGTICTRIIEAYTRSDAMGCVCGFVLSCELA